jgi:hypothetical protein
LDIHQDKVRTLPRGEYCFLAILCLDHVVAGTREKIAKDATVIFLIFDDEDAPAHA